MDKFTHLADFLGNLFDDVRTAKKAQVIMAGILQARSCRLRDIARDMAGNEAVNYKCIQRIVEETALKLILLWLFQEEDPFLIGDPTEMPRPEAQKTDYIGTLSDGQTSGYLLLILVTPYQGRAIPCHFVGYSSSIIGTEVTSRSSFPSELLSELRIRNWDRAVHRLSPTDSRLIPVSTYHQSHDRVSN